MSGGIRRAQYREDRPGKTTPYPGSPLLPFSAFCVSGRVLAPTMKVARAIAATAKVMSPEGEDSRPGKPAYSESFVTHPGKPVKIDGLSRVTGLVGNVAPHAAAVEFGSGEGSTDGEDRPQGGGNLPFRVLGRAGARYGDFHE